MLQQAHFGDLAPGQTLAVVRLIAAAKRRIAPDITNHRLAFATLATPADLGPQSPALNTPSGAQRKP